MARHGFRFILQHQILQHGGDSQPGARGVGQEGNHTCGDTKM